jgi:hypothetical protein
MEISVYSPSNRFKLTLKIINDDSIKVKVYSSKTNELCGKVKFNCEHLAYCFYQKQEKEYIILGISSNNYTIINCETGHYFEQSVQENDEFKWMEIFIFDNRTLYVLGKLNGIDQYKFYDFSNENKLIPLDVYFENLPFVFDIHLPRPLIMDDILTFTIKEKRIHGIGKRKSDFDVKDLDLLLEEYEKQEQDENGYLIFMSEEKEYELDIVRIKMIRSDQYMEIVEFWMDKNFEKEQISEQNKNLRKQQQKELEEQSNRYQKIKSILEPNLKKFRKIQYNSIESGEKFCHIHLFPLDTKSYHFHLSFSYLDESIPLKIEFHNLRKNNIYNNTITFWNEEYILDFISE